MIYVTGDTHGTIDFDKLVWFSIAHPRLSKNDYVIIAGDFGGVFGPGSEAMLDRFSALPMSILFVDGNHEDFPRLAAYPEEKWNGGRVHRVRQDILHLMRGQVFRLGSKTLFTFGGAESHDRAWRTEGINWWRAEKPSRADVREAVRNLDAVGWEVDYVVTHSCDTYSLRIPPILDCHRPEMAENRLLSLFEEWLRYQHWYFGHYHCDGNLNSRKTVLFREVIPLGASAPRTER